MRDAPVQILVGGPATALFARRGDRWWLAASKGMLISVVFSAILDMALAITTGTGWARSWRRS